MRSVFKVAPEALWGHGRFAAEAQFFFLNVARKEGLGSFQGLGCYALGRVLLNRGARYSYSPWIGYLATPAPRSWEIGPVTVTPTSTTPEPESMAERPTRRR